MPNGHYDDEAGVCWPDEGDQDNKSDSPDAGTSDAGTPDADTSDDFIEDVIDNVCFTEDCLEQQEIDTVLKYLLKRFASD